MSGVLPGAHTGSVQYTLEPTVNPPTKGSSPIAEALVFTGSHLLTASGGQFSPLTVTDWPLAPNDLAAAAACTEADRNLTSAEWTQYVGTFDAYEKTCADLR